ncbi:MAG: hypothetical protein ACW981_11555 [Candidatus Hodarchaeales archaeon]|jgi:cytidylate kinase
MKSGTQLPFLYEKEEELCKAQNLKLDDFPYRQLSGPVIAIGGYSGVGKDTLASGLKLLFKKKYRIDLRTIGAGTIMRNIAVDEGFDEAHLDAFLAKLKEDKEFGNEVDRRMEERTLTKAITMKKGIFIGRMAPFAVGGWGFSIWVKTDIEVNASRIISDPHRPEYGMNFEEVLNGLGTRDKEDKARLELNYETSLDNLIEKSDLILDNSNSDIDETLRIAFDATRRFYKLNDV